MAYLWATWLPAVLRGAGVPVVEHSGWQNRGLAGGTFEPNSVVWHHDASPVGDSPGVPAYLLGNFSTASAQVWIDRSGVWHLIAAGRAPHAGAVLPGMPGNSTSLGIETDHTTGEDWPPPLLASLRVGTAAILAYLRRGPDGLHFHKTICDPVGRKSDPDGLSLASERAALAALMNGETMATAAEVWGQSLQGAASGPAAASTYQVHTLEAVYAQAQKIASLDAKVTALVAKVDALAAKAPGAGGSVTDADLARIAQAVGDEFARRQAS